MEFLGSFRFIVKLMSNITKTISVKKKDLKHCHKNRFKDKMIKKIIH